MNFEIEIDGIKIEARAGESIADSAKRAKVDIPRLCNTNGVGHRAGCMVCAVFDLRANIFLPSCASRVSEGVKIESNSARVFNFRKTALELLLAEHKGDCLAPCRKACPYGFDIPKFLEYVSGEKFDSARAMLKESPQCESCNALCEKVCRKKLMGDSVKIREVIAKFKPENQALAVRTKKDLAYTHNFGRPSNDELKKLQETSNDVNGCLQCHCKKESDCKLRQLASEFKLTQPKPASVRKFDRARANGVVFESGKCVLCASCAELGGLCIRGRAYMALPDKPETCTWSESLLKAHISTCPTGALSRDDTYKSE